MMDFLLYDRGDSEVDSAGCRYGEQHDSRDLTLQSGGVPQGLPPATGPQLRRIHLHQVRGPLRQQIRWVI